MGNRTYHSRNALIDGFAARQHPSYFTWANMLARCYNPDNVGYANYGGRGIAVSPEWHHFAAFARDMGPKPNPALTIERRNNDLGYSPENCKWGTRTEQSWNRRRFKNNTTGHRGVVEIRGRFLARFDYERERYDIGRFATATEAAVVREAFVGLFFRDRPAALALLEEETLRYDSTTGVRGVTPHPDGGFMARVTINKVREYLGYFETVEEAAAAIAKRKGKK